LWRGTDGATLRSETWTRTQGYGRNEENVPGSRLCGNRGFLQAFLGSFLGNRLVLSVEVRRQPPHYGGSKAEFEAYPGPYMRFYLMGSDAVAVSL